MVTLPQRVRSGAIRRYRIRMTLACQWYHLAGRKVPMALNIKDDSVHEAVKRITVITGESQAQAVATAVRERLARLESDVLRWPVLLAIGHKSASRMSADVKALDHDALLYDDRGLPS